MGEKEDSLHERKDVKKIEAILFIAGRFLDLKELVALSDLNPLTIKEILALLEKEYQERDSSIKLVRKNNLWKMDVDDEHSYLANRLATGSSEFSGAERETLAIIAFKQPIKQSVLVKIRGNKSYDHIKRFFELGLIKKKKMGHTYELSLSEEFYNYFNVSKEGTVSGR